MRRMYLTGIFAVVVVTVALLSFTIMDTPGHAETLTTTPGSIVIDLNNPDTEEPAEAAPHLKENKVVCFCCELPGVGCTIIDNARRATNSSERAKAAKQDQALKMIRAGNTKTAFASGLGKELFSFPPEIESEILNGNMTLQETAPGSGQFQWDFKQVPPALAERLNKCCPEDNGEKGGEN